MLDAKLVSELLQHYAGWDASDIDRIVAPLANDVVFTSPFVTASTDGASGSVHGKEAVHDYMAAALELIPRIRYTVESAYVGNETLIIIWTAHFPDGIDRDGADFMKVDAQGKVLDLRAHYTWDPSEVLA